MSTFLVRCVLKAWGSRPWAPKRINVYILYQICLKSLRKQTRSSKGDILVNSLLSWWWLHLQWCCYQSPDFVCIYNDFNIQVLIILVVTRILLSKFVFWLYLQWFQHPRADCACIYNDFVMNTLILFVFTMISACKLWLWLYLQWLKHTL